MKPLRERLRMVNRCRRCSCPACDRDPAGELHGHICTKGEGCVDTAEKLLALRTGFIYLAIEAEARIAALEKQLAELVEGYDIGALEMNSPEIGGHDDIPPHPWHEEWLHHARALLPALSPPSPDKEQ